MSSDRTRDNAAGYRICCCLSEVCAREGCQSILTTIAISDDSSLNERISEINPWECASDAIMRVSEAVENTSLIRSSVHPATLRNGSEIKSVFFGYFTQPWALRIGGCMH